MDVEEFLEDEEELSPICEEELYYFLQHVGEIEAVETDMTAEDLLKIEEATQRAELLLSRKEDDIAKKGRMVNLEKTDINDNAVEECKAEAKDPDQDHNEPEELKPHMEYATWCPQDREERRDIAEGYKLNGNRAYREGNYERALQQFNLAIDLVKDSGVLYTNRALTLINLGIQSRAISDCEWALKVDENNLRAWLYKAKAHQLLGEKEQEGWCIEEAVTRYPQQETFICAFKSLWDLVTSQDE